MIKANKFDRNAIFLCVIAYVFLFFSIFKVYYTSPLVTGINNIRYDNAKKSDLVFLIVADGLRPDKFFPEFYSKFETKGFPNLKVGYSHTRVPTESRPGHLALLGGFYEDVSAVTKGWKSNPIEFDSVFNHTCQGLAWGGPDVVPYFRPYGISNHEFNNFYQDERVLIESFPPVMLDMNDENVTAVDRWTWVKFKTYFSVNAQQILSSDCSSMRGNKNGRIIFLHLNAADQVGHNWKPGSKQYTEVVDYLNQFISDLKTFMAEYERTHRISYVFTSDHGMTDWGSHGSGSDAETLTAFISWGNGFTKEPRKDVDIEQADVCSILSFLLGSDIPSNSIGKLPYELFDLTQEEQYKCLLTDTLQVLNQLTYKYHEEKANHYQITEYPLLSHDEAEKEYLKFHHITKDKKDHMTDLMRLREELIRAKYYYHTYDRLYQTFLVISMYILLMVFFLVQLVEEEPHSARREYKRSVYFFLTANVLNTIHGLTISWRNWLFHFVLSMLITFSLDYCRLRKVLIIFKGNLLNIFISFVMVELAIFSFHGRYFLSVGLSLVSFISLQRMDKNDRNLKSLIISNCVLSIFPFLPVVGSMKASSLLVFISGFGSFAPVLFTQTLSRERPFKYLRSTVVVLSMVTGVLLEFPQYHNYLIFITSWTLTLIPIPMFICMNKFYTDRLSYNKRLEHVIYGYALLLSIPIHLMSLGYETVFYWTLVCNLIIWLERDCNILSTKSGGARQDQLQDSLNVSVFYIFYVVLAFFGTGNIASINGFDPVSTHCYITTLIPAIMGALMIYKMTCPIIFVSLVFSVKKKQLVSQHESKKESIGSSSSINYLSFAISTLMSAHFFCWLLDDGSWADIGISISHYVIAMAMGLVSSVFLILGEILIY